MNAAFFALLLVPLTIGIKQVAFGTDVIVDVFTWYKAALVLILGAFACYGHYRPQKWLVVWVVLSCLFSKVPEFAWWGFPNQYFGGAALLALLALGANPPSEKHIVQALMWGSIPISLCTMFPELIPWHWIGKGYELHINGKGASTLYNVNYVGFYVAMVFPVLFSYRKCPMCIISMLLLVGALYQSGSLAGLIATTVGVTFVLWYEGMRWMAFLPAEIGALYLATRWKAGFGGRLEIWRNTISIIHPLGSGLGVFPFEYPQTGTEMVDKPHSMYLQVAHAFGGVGLGVVLASLVRWRPRSVAMSAGLVGGLVAGLTNDLYIGVAPILFILLGAS